MFKIGKLYKIKTVDSFYTAEILEVDDFFILIRDKFGVEVGIKKELIKDFKQLEE